MRPLEAIAGVVVFVGTVALSYAFFSPDERQVTAGGYAITPVVEKGTTAAFYAPVDLSSPCPMYQLDFLIYPNGQRRQVGVERRVGAPTAQTSMRVPLNARDGDAFYHRVLRIDCGNREVPVETPPIPFEIVSRKSEPDG